MDSIMLRCWCTLVSSFVAALALPGCGGGKDSGTGTPAASAPDETIRSGGQIAATGSDSAAASLEAAVAGFRDHKPLAIWEFLPAGYQRDVNGLLRDFGRQMDPELWSRVRTVAGKLAALLRERRELFLAYPPLQDDPAIAAGPLKQLASNWHVAVGLLEALAAADLDSLRTFDGRKAFAGLDRDDLARLRQLAVLLPDENPFSLLDELIAGAEVRPLDATGDRARVQVVLQNAEPREFEFIRVEGRWFPAAWQAVWETELAAAREKLRRELSAEVLAQKKQSLLPALDAWESALDRLAAESDAQAFYDLLDRELLPVLSGTAPGTAEERPATRQPAAAPASGGTITVAFTTPLDERTSDAVAQALIGLCDHPDGIVLPVAGRGTRLAVSPVSNVQAFARRIRFGRVTAVDVEQRLVMVELPPSGALDR
jgi:hypothetical protein